MQHTAVLSASYDGFSCQILSTGGRFCKKCTSSRRIKRDVNKRGRTLESVLKQYQDTVKPMHERYVEPSKKYANIVVPEGGKNLVALDMIIGRIQRHLEEA